MYFTLYVSIFCQIIELKVVTHVLNFITSKNFALKLNLHKTVYYQVNNFNNLDLFSKY